MKYVLFMTFFLFIFLNNYAQEKTPYFKKTENGMYALFSADGQQITEPLYIRGGNCYDGICKTWKTEYGLGFIDYSGKEITSFKYLYAHYLSEGLIAVRENRDWGFIDIEGNLKIPFKFSSAYNFSEGLCAIAIRINNEEKFGFINSDGEIVIEPIYEEAHSFSEGFASVKLNGNWGYVDRNGQPITPFKYCKVEEFKNGIANVGIDCGIEEFCGLGYSTQGFINNKGKEIIPVMFSDVKVWKQIDVIEVNKNRNAGLYDFKGNVIVPFGKYLSIHRLDDETGLIKVTGNTKEVNGDGFITQQGKEIISPLYKFRGPFINGYIYGGKYSTEEEIKELSKTKKSFSYHRYGVIDSLGKIIIPFKFDGVNMLRHGYFAVNNYTDSGSSAFGYFNSKGEQTLPFKYFYGSDFSSKGYALVKDRYDSDLYFIDTKGNLISTPKFDEIDSFIMDNLVLVKQNNKWGFIDAQSEVIIDFLFEKAERFHKNLARVSNNNKFGYINTEGEIVISIKFDKADYYFTDEVEELELDGKKYFFDRTGKEVAPSER